MDPILGECFDFFFVDISIQYSRWRIGRSVGKVFGDMEMWIPTNLLAEYGITTSNEGRLRV